MGYYIEKKVIISAKKNIDDMTIPELYERMNKIDERQKRLAEARKRTDKVKDQTSLEELKKYNEQRAEERKKQYEKK